MSGFRFVDEKIGTEIGLRYSFCIKTGDAERRGSQCVRTQIATPIATSLSDYLSRPSVAVFCAYKNDKNNNNKTVEDAQFDSAFTSEFEEREKPSMVLMSLVDFCFIQITSSECC